mmetsp:Transcript_50552/g.161711  ORF Transcript_50552/g.161711 Transcript_50552/m.161711 type:complete len:277 (+) Transcript_50552:521-1351(+)
MTMLRVSTATSASCPKRRGECRWMTCEEPEGGSTEAISTSSLSEGSTPLGVRSSRWPAAQPVAALTTTVLDPAAARCASFAHGGMGAAPTNSMLPPAETRSLSPPRMEPCPSVPIDPPMDAASGVSARRSSNLELRGASVAPALKSPPGFTTTIPAHSVIASVWLTTSRVPSMSIRAKQSPGLLSRTACVPKGIKATAALGLLVSAPGTRPQEERSDHSHTLPRGRTRTTNRPEITSPATLTCTTTTYCPSLGNEKNATRVVGMCEPLGLWRCQWR